MKNLTILAFILFLATGAFSQKKKKAEPEKPKTAMEASTFNALKFRNIGPSLTSGRIADIAIHPKHESTWYVAVGSGGVWKTTNAGTTWKPIFDSQPSYSIGCVTIDQRNPATIWVGTGENVGGRHVGFGDGIYRSADGGKSWKNMGLKKSEHISKIVVHPDNSDIIWVAAQGPLWSKGDERGLYKSTDGGKTWKKTLGDAEWTGVTDIVIDPNTPMRLYAATWQRHRTVAAYLGGGPESGIHRSEDGGETWEKLKTGLPSGALGKIGLTISPFDSDRVYAAIETVRTKGGVWMSTNRGSSWTKQSDMTSGGTGPHYYQELYADPHHEGRLYLMNNTVLISHDHGKTYARMNEKNKHVDTHAIAWKKSDPDYIIMGTDGGLYETYDQTKTWKQVKNLPLTQFYKVAVDDAEPFYNVYGGTQDNGSMGGPSRTTNSAGIYNKDWRIVLGADGHQSATEPGNPNITYGEFQQGWLWRIDHTTGESVFVQPQAGEGDPHERFNWDAPILVSSHDPKRIYFASYRVWRSDNRGDDWNAISTDLTRNQERIELPIMGQQQGWDNAWDIGAMSEYNTITSLAESPKDENILYAGTDDGIIQVTEDGGTTWRKIMTGAIPGIPATAFVNDIRADLFDANTVYCSLDNHKYGDFKPYFIKSTDSGRTWTSLTSNLPKRTLVWRMVQDHVQPNLLFLATEFGVYFTVDGGMKWIQLKGGLPTIAIRDITIQRRENDLAIASFGRGFYILDDYSALRDVSAQSLNKEAILFASRPALWYSELGEIYGQGDSEWLAKNPDYGATFTYYLKDGLKSLKDERKAADKKKIKAKQEVGFPGWDKLEAERRQPKPAVMLTITDTEGNIIKQINGKSSKGIHRTTWNLSQSSKGIVRLQTPRGGRRFGRGGAKVTPGKYMVTLSKVVDGVKTDLSEPMPFEVKRLMEPHLPGASYDEIAAFKSEFESFQNDMTATNMSLRKGISKIGAIKRALQNADRQPTELIAKIYEVENQLTDMDIAINGNKVKGEIGERTAPTPSDGMFVGFVGMGTTHGPTGNHKGALNRAVKQLAGLKTRLAPIIDNSIPELMEMLKATGAPTIEE